MDNDVVIQFLEMKSFMIVSEIVLTDEIFHNNRFDLSLPQVSLQSTVSSIRNLERIYLKHGPFITLILQYVLEVHILIMCINMALTDTLNCFFITEFNICIYLQYICARIHVSSSNYKFHIIHVKCQFHLHFIFDISNPR